ncbi:hypothetical protein AM493_14625 [Flavobacterium akiainvivens]|uniref:Lipoprotein n=1 Tax=Flavobacterium akiainvivens TaxID=1202724 RepID=A0A0M9VIX7_9FLAO|nr:hypothetical protein [Flavobacterium akiainvivens]KOS07136.1 hypothetical protein AM493_14625 [Flavobacterium akiainvivens]
MKKIIVMAAAFVALVSCSADNDVHEFQLDFVPVVAVEAPEFVTPGLTSEFKLYYKRPNDCYYINGFDYEAAGNVRTVAVQAIVLQDSDCVSMETAAAESIIMPFQCPPNYSQESYVFRFYGNPDGTMNGAPNGESSYIQIEVPVAQ